MPEVDRLTVILEAKVAEYLRDLDRANRGTQAFESNVGGSVKRAGVSFGGLGRTMAVVAGAAGIGGLAVAAAGLGRSIVGSAASFEFEMSRIKAVTGGTTKSLAPLREQIIELGKVTAFSAGEAAQGANELVKAGMTIGQATAALPGMLALAAAGELEVGAAAEITANALNTFNLNANESVRVADALANAANQSSTDVDLLGQSFSMVGSLAASAGMTVEETAAALALLANNGMKGSDAGTSLKQMLMSLQAPSDKAAQLMESLGVNAYDAQGNMKDFGSIIADFAQGLAGSTQEEKDFALATIFGSDAVRSANILLREGADNYENMTESVGKAGEAQRIAGQKMDNLRGSWEELKGSLETLAIGVGTPLMGGLKEVVDAVTDAVNKVTEFQDSLTNIAGWEGADFTDKIKIAWEALDQQLNDWLEGPSSDELIINAKFGFQEVSGIEQLKDAGRGVGEAISDALIQLIGVEADSGTGALARAGGAIWTGFKEAFDPTELITAGGERLGKSLLQMFMPDESSMVAFGESFAGKFWDALPWTDDAVDESAAEEGEEAGASFFDAVIGGIVKYQMSQQLGEEMDSTKEAGAEGRGAGSEFGNSFINAADAKLRGWAPAMPLDPWAQRAGARGGSGFGADLLAELMQNLPAMGGGLSGHTGQVAAQIAGRFGLSMISGLRPGATIRNTGKPSLHASGRGTDWGGSTPALWAAFNWLASNAGQLGIQEILYRDKAWSTGVPRVHYNTNAQSRADHMDHLHVGFRYHSGGLVGGDVPAVLQVGERVITAEQNSFLADALSALREVTEALRAQVNKDTAAGERRQAFEDRLIDAFQGRSQTAASYVGREQSRLSMQEATGADTATRMATLENLIAFLDKSTAEAQAQLDLAKSEGLDPETINELAGSLFDLQSEAADARGELEALARVPLEDAIASWENDLEDLDRLMNLFADHSNAAAMQLELLPSQLGASGSIYQTNLDLMRGSTNQADIASYGASAQGALVEMYGQEKGALRRALDETQDSIDSAEDAWRDAWEKRADAIDDASEREQDSYDRRQKAIDEAFDQERKALQKSYDARLEAIDKELALLDKREQGISRKRRLGDLQSELSSIMGQEGKTEADVRRIHELQQEISRTQEDYRLEDQRARIMAERDAAQAAMDTALSNLDARRAKQEELLAVDQEHQAKRVEQERAALEEERKAQEEHFALLRAQADAAYQAELDQAIERYAGMLTAVQEEQTKLEEAAGGYTNAGRLLGESFAQGILDSIPAITAAAAAAAAAAAQYLELHSPAKAGPLANLDHWWDGFIPTLQRPLANADLAPPSMDTLGPSGTTSSSRSVDVNVTLSVDSSAAGVDTETLRASLEPVIVQSVLDELQAGYTTMESSWGRV